MVISLDLGIVVLIMAGCLIATYSDIKYGKISNKLVLGYGCVPVICNIINVAHEGEWLNYIINFSIVIIIAVLLYSFHVWAGGDCKMLIFIALATPVSLYWNLNGFVYNFCYIYIFVFSFGFLYVCFDNIKMFCQKRRFINKGEFIREFKANIYKYIRTIIYLSLIGHVYLICIYQYIEIPAILYTLACIAFILLVSKIAILNSKWIVILVAVIDFVLFIITGNMTISSMWYTYVIVISLMIMRLVSKVFNYDDIETCDVECGMILSQETSILLKNSKVKGLPGISDETLKSRLSEDEVEAVRRWGKSKYGLESIKIVRKIPFAVFITIGLIAYLILGCVFF